jgi:hypothetical protein
MTTPAFPTPAQLLGGPAQALAGIERSLPLGAPPIAVSQVLQSLANSVPALPAPGATGGLPFPAIGAPLGATPNILAAILPQAPRAPVRTAVNGSPLVLPAGRTGIG